MQKFWQNFARKEVSRLKYFWYGLNESLDIRRYSRLIYRPIMERWPSGLRRRSWKPLCCEVPGVRIPPAPLNKGSHVPFLLHTCSKKPILRQVIWSGARVAESGSLLRSCTHPGTGGSNPPCSVKQYEIGSAVRWRDNEVIDDRRILLVYLRL